MPFDQILSGLRLPAVKPLLVSCFIWFQVAPHPQASPEHFRYQRSIRLPQSATPLTGESCAVLDASVFTHSSPSLKDLRLYAGNTEAGRPEIPYAITLSEPLQQDTEEARILNLGTRGGHVLFDLAMPRRPYTTVALNLDAHDFIATAVVSGRQSLDDREAAATSLGSFTLFDLSSQHLSHSTSLPLAESSFPYLTVDLVLAAAPGTSGTPASLNLPEIVESASVPPSREGQIVYTTMQQASTFVQRGRESVATFQVPARVPVERIAFTVAPAYKGNFSRSIRIEARAVPGQKPDSSNESDFTGGDDIQTFPEAATGTILSVHKVEAGREIAQEDLAVPTAIGANMQHLATLEVAIENGDDAPLPMASVQLQMRQRRICFDAATAGSSPLTLYYGDSALEAPVYDYAKLFLPSATPLAAGLFAEEANPSFTPRADSRPFTERHPELLWIVLLAVVCILALTAFRSAKRLPR